jgi:biopolymer transport protein ExbD
MMEPIRKPPEIFKDVGTAQFGIVMAMAMLVPVLIFMLTPTPYHSLSPDLPRVSHPVAMPDALRDDAIRVAITRDGAVYFASDKVDPTYLADKIAERLEGHVVERKVYLVVDRRARWGSVKCVLDGIRSAEVLRVAFVVDQRRISRFDQF